MSTSIVSKRVDKDDAFIEVEGTVDELMSHLTLASVFVKDEKLKDLLKKLCKELYMVSGDAIGYGNKKVSLEDVKRLEILIDDYNGKLPQINDFIELGSKPSSATIHVARTICRRLERRLVTLAKREQMNPEVLKYVNRLSDLLFVLGRYEEEVNV